MVAIPALTDFIQCSMRTASNPVSYKRWYLQRSEESGGKVGGRMMYRGPRPDVYNRTRLLTDWGVCLDGDLVRGWGPRVSLYELR